ncbi:hypothetical protein Taro_019380 [Colocasia esculenta]|uniref:Uncharacterized protein n=1 Tax=Colocasia esculenta TaxID=4460 RepID=A0A843UWL5_COLES|nr:hypothetical protein [Colocasia esculenta]
MIWAIIGLVHRCCFFWALGLWECYEIFLETYVQQLSCVLHDFPKAAEKSTVFTSRDLVFSSLGGLPLPYEAAMLVGLLVEVAETATIVVVAVQAVMVVMVVVAVEPPFPIYAETILYQYSSYMSLRYHQGLTPVQADPEIAN